MAGGGSQTQQNPLAAAANAQASGTAGTAAGATQTAAMPAWQKGLMGAMTGNPAFGQNAPAIHSLMAQGLGMGGQGIPQTPMPQQGQMPQQAAPPGMPQRPMGPGMAPPGMATGGMGMPNTQQNPMMAGLQNPWMRTQ
jgi:hypothetical protein